MELPRGIPFTVSELEQASKQPPDPYHRDLMQWAAARIRALEAHAAQHEQKSEPTT